MSNHGLEWLCRLMKNLGGHAKWYMVDDSKIIKLIIKYRNASKKKIYYL